MKAERLTPSVTEDDRVHLAGVRGRRTDGEKTLRSVRQSGGYALKGARNLNDPCGVKISSFAYPSQ
jgi:hypothetical protein